MKAPLFSVGFCLTSLITACSSPTGPNAWTPVTSGAPRAPIHQNEVLVIDEYPMGEYTNVGHFDGPDGRIVHVSMDDKELINYFTKEAAAMGGNTVASGNRASATAPEKAKAAGWTSSTCGRKWERTGRKTWAWIPCPLMKNPCGSINPQFQIRTPFSSCWPRRNADIPHGCYSE